MESSTIALIIIGVMLILYVTELLPIATTSILACLAMAVFGVIPMNEAFAGFGNDIVYLIVGMVIVGTALFETGVAKLVGNKIISAVGIRERLLMLGLIAVATALSMFLSNTATVAIMLPIAASAAAASGGKLTNKSTYMMIAIASVMGGGLTIIGSTPQLIAQGLIVEMGYAPIGFFELSRLGLPILILMVIFYQTIGLKLQRKVFGITTVPDVAAANENTAKITSAATSVGTVAKTETADSDPPKSVVKMCISVAILAFCVVGFMTSLWTPGIVAMIGAVACVATGCLSQKRLFEKMDWTTVVIMGCSFGISAGLEQSGAGSMIAQGMINLLGNSMSPWLLAVVLAFTATVLTNFMSSTATAALLVPIAAFAAMELGYDVRSMIIAVAMAANIGYGTPISTPPMTMAMSAGYRFIDYVKMGGLVNLLAFILLCLLFPIMLNL